MMEIGSFRTRLLFTLDGILINASVVLTAGIFLSGYIVFLDGSDFLVGLLNNSMTWASIAALFSFLVYERMERRKGLLMFLLISSRLLVCSTIFLPLVFGKAPIVLTLLTIMIILGHTLWGIYAVGANVWMMNSITKSARSAFIYMRVFWIRIFYTAVIIIMGFVLDWSGKSYTGFLITFLASLFFSLADAFILYKIDEPPNLQKKHTAFNLKLFMEPLKNADYRPFLVFVLLFYTSLTLASSFTPLYLIRYLELDYSFISIVNVISYIFMILFTKVWSRHEKKKDMLFVFKLSAFIVALELVVYVFLNKNTYLLLFLAPVFSGIGNSGFSVAILNYRYELMPEENKTLYEGWFGAVLGISLLASPIIGTLIMNKVPMIQLSSLQFNKFQFLYFLAFFLGTLVVFFTLRRPKKAKIPSKMSESA